jgi:hypothetical protein
MRRTIALAAGLALTLTACGGTQRAAVTAPSSTSPSGAAASTSVTPPAASTSIPTPTATSTSRAPAPATSTANPTAPGTATPTPVSFPYVPLWPFASVAAAERWQQEAGSGGHQPWHLDADQVALTFTRTYLGFTEIDRVVHRKVGADDAHISVGYATEGGRTGTAAVLHLVRIGSGPDRPWEVVGTDDSDFSLTHPRYGSTVTGTVTVGGHISGVDESIRVTARQPAGTVGSFCCLPAGGGQAGQAWAARVRLTDPREGPLTLVASTGGHLLGVERFTITGVHATR